MSLGLRICAFGLICMVAGLLVSEARANERARPELFASVQHLGPSAATRLKEGSPTAAPFAYFRYCVDNPEDCRETAGRDIQWNRTSRDVVQETNSLVNGSIRATAEVGDSWKAGVWEGDCEDFALTKRRALIRKGLPGSSLRMALAFTRQGDVHAVLVVRTNVGDFVLDNRTDDMLMPNRTDLTWIKIASARTPLVWRALD